MGGGAGVPPQNRELSLNLADSQKLGEHGHGHRRGGLTVPCPNDKANEAFLGRSGKTCVLFDVYDSSTGIRKIRFTAERLLEIAKPHQSFTMDIYAILRRTAKGRKYGG